MIYLAMLTSRVPVIPPFTSEIGGDRVPIPFSEIFDLPYLRHKLRIPVLEWSDIKDTALAANTDAPHDELGCWNLWQVQSIVADGPRASFSTDTLGLGTVALELPEGFAHEYRQISRIPVDRSGSNSYQASNTTCIRRSGLSHASLSPRRATRYWRTLVPIPHCLRTLESISHLTSRCSATISSTTLLEPS